MHIYLNTYNMYLYYCSHDYQLVFGTDVSIPMTKAQRMLYGESAMTHAMVLTAVNIEVSKFDEFYKKNNLWSVITFFTSLFRMVMQPSGVLRTLGAKTVVKKVTWWWPLNGLRNLYLKWLLTKVFYLKRCCLYFNKNLKYFPFGIQWEH